MQAMAVLYHFDRSVVAIPVLSNPLRFLSLTDKVILSYVARFLAHINDKSVRGSLINETSELDLIEEG